MALPFFSIDFKFKDLTNLFLSILFPFNKKKMEIKFIKKLKERFPDKYISLLPSGRLGFYLTLKEYFKEGDDKKLFYV